MYRELKAPMAVHLEITSQCNNHCYHCYNYWREGGENDQSLDANQAEKVMTILAENEVLYAVLTGGEPLLHPMVVARAIESARQKGIHCSLNSNLTVLPRQALQVLERYKVPVLTSLLSFDPDTHDTMVQHPGAHAKTLRNISALVSLGIPVAVNMVVMQGNLDHIYRTGQLAHSLGARKFSANRVSPAENCRVFDQLMLSREMALETLDQMRRLKRDLGIQVGTQNCYPLCLIGDLDRYREVEMRTCGAGALHCTVGADGEVRACLQTSKSYGNLFDEPLGSIWAGMKPWRDGSYIPAACKQCEHLQRCTGGCRADCQFHSDLSEMDYYAVNGKPVKFTEPPVSEINLEARVAIPELGFRDEEFGVLVYLPGKLSQPPLLTKDSAEMLKELMASELPLKLIADRYGLDADQLGTFLAGLAQYGIMELSD